MMYIELFNWHWFVNHCYLSVSSGCFSWQDPDETNGPLLEQVEFNMWKIWNLIASIVTVVKLFVWSEYINVVNLLKAYPPDNHSPSHSHRRTVPKNISYSNMDVFGRWEEAGLPGESWHRHRPPQRLQTGWWSQTQDPLIVKNLTVEIAVIYKYVNKIWSFLLYFL